MHGVGLGGWPESAQPDSSASDRVLFHYSANRGALCMKRDSFGGDMLQQRLDRKMEQNGIVSSNRHRAT